MTNTPARGTQDSKRGHTQEVVTGILSTLVVPGRRGLICALLVGLASGSAIAMFPNPKSVVGLDPASVAIGDFDGDGRQDLAVANLGSDDVSVLLNQLPMLIDFDIKPHSINPYGRGVVSVAIFGSEEFDVTEIDVSSLRFGSSEAACTHDLTDPFDYNEHLEDMNLDGYMDLMTHYRVQETGIACGDTEATLSGQTQTGQFIEGSDSIRTVGCTSSRPINRRQPQRIQLEPATSVRTGQAEEGRVEVTGRSALGGRDANSVHSGRLRTMQSDLCAARPIRSRKPPS